MKKVFSWIKSNILFIETLFLLAFIPLYPKIPLINIRNTWVYVRAEDFVILLVLFSWIFLLLKKKINLRTPLTLPIITFWIIGAVATIHGVLLIFPDLANVFPNVAFLSLVRHIEYLSLFFVAYHSMKEKGFLKFVIITLIATLLGVIFYGFGQRYLGFPAFLTSNEEFAKGIPIQLSQLSRVPSTFAGHYDLAAYLVLLIPILISLFFGIKNLFTKFFLLIVAGLSFILLFMTVSRVSFFVVFISLLFVLFFQKRKLIVISIPIIILAGILFLAFKPTVLQRFKSTVSNVDVLVDAKTGDSVGHVKFLPASYFKDKIVLQTRVKNEAELVSALAGEKINPASSSAILPFELIPQEVPLVEAVNVSTGESLPQGTGYINLTLSPVVRRLGNFFYEFPPNVKSSPSAQFLVLHGDFIVKKAAAYDLSFTTRFQGEWPRALSAFQRNILTGSGYGSVSLAVDNNYLRMLGEVGLLGSVAFFAIFISFGIYLKKAWPDINGGLEKSFLIGFSAGVIGLFLNAALIDVFEASKIAYLLWMLTGVSMGLIMLYQKTQINLRAELKKTATSTYAVIIYLLSLGIVLYSPMINNFFVGDDFTWLKWAAQPPSNFLTYFTQSDGFFYRPGTKIYFYLIYHFFWLNPVVYHVVSIALHVIVASLVFLLAKKIFKNTLLSASAAFIFLIMSGYTEMVFWIASTGHLFTAVFGLLGLLLFIEWEEKKKIYYYLFSIIFFSLSLLFHELGVVLPLLVLAYKFKDSFSSVKKTLLRKDFLFLFVPVVLYLLVRLSANSHWFQGDYNYNLVRLPFNLFGNILGYLSLTIVGTFSLSFYEKIRILTRENLLITLAIILPLLGVIYYLYKKLVNLFEKEEKSVILFGFSFFIVSLLPFLGLGDITSRYSYLASVGTALILVVLIKKVYLYLLDSGKEIALGIVAVLVMVYSLFNIISIQQSAADWAGAATKTNNFFVSFDSLYNDYWSKENINFHFVNVPIKVGGAWVFPVGLKDAVWFAVKNDNAKIYIDKDVNSALSELGPSIINKLFVFNDDGTISEITQRNKQ